MGKKGDTTREKILQASLEIFQHRGIGASSIALIAEETGIQKGSIYYFFPSKDDLAFETLARAKEKFIAFLEKSLDTKAPRESLHNYFRAIVKYHRERGLRGGCIFGNSALEMSEKNERIRQLLCDTFVEWKNMVKEVIEAGIQAGEFRGDMDPEDMAWQVVSTIEGGIMISRTCRDIRHLQTALEKLEEWIQG